MVDSNRMSIQGGMFLFKDIHFQEIFTPEDFSSENKDVAKAAEDFMRGEIISRGEEIEMVNNELSRELTGKAGELGFLRIDIPVKMTKILFHDSLE